MDPPAPARRSALKEQWITKVTVSTRSMVNPGDAEKEEFKVLGSMEDDESRCWSFGPMIVSIGRKGARTTAGEVKRFALCVG